MTHQNDQEDGDDGEDESLVGRDTNRPLTVIVVRHRAIVGHGLRCDPRPSRGSARPVSGSRSDRSSVLRALLDPWYSDHHGHLGATLCTALVSQVLRTAATRAVCVAPSA